MARESKIPDEIKQYLPGKCTRAKLYGDTYRVVKYEAYKTPSGKWSSGHEKLIGKIIPGVGFCPNKYYMQLLAEQGKIPCSDKITDLSYGCYALLDTLADDIHKMLRACFTYEKSAQIYAFAMIIAANGFLHLDQINDYYQESFLCYMFRDYAFKMGYSALSSLLTELGKKEEPVCEFEQNLIDSSSGKVAIDGHAIRSRSEENDLAEKGYKYSKLGAEQMNLLVAYDVVNKLPLAYRTFRGSKPDKSSVLDFLANRHFTNTKFVVDKGFYSAKVLSMMSKDGNTYIIPVQSNNKHYQRIKKNLQYSSGEFIYRAGKKDSARVEYYEEEVSPGKRIIVYRDIDENNSTRKSYKMCMAQGEDGYTQERYNELCEWWGVLVIETNSKDSAQQIYEDYKGRWSVETYFNYFKNDAGFSGLKFQDYYAIKGFDFIMLIAGLIHSKLNAAVRELNMPDISTHDLLAKAGHLRLVLNGDNWLLQNTRTKDLELLAKVGFEPKVSYPASTK